MSSNADKKLTAKRHGWCHNNGDSSIFELWSLCKICNHVCSFTCSNAVATSTTFPRRLTSRKNETVGGKRFDQNIFLSIKKLIKIPFVFVIHDQNFTRQIAGGLYLLDVSRSQCMWIFCKTAKLVAKICWVNTNKPYVVDFVNWTVHELHVRAEIPT